MDINEKKLFIYKNINNIDDHSEIIKYIKNNDIKYTNNNNGFFVNISLIDAHIDNLYNILQYYINNNNENDLLIDIKKQISLETINFNNNNYNNNNNNKDDDKKYNFPLDQFKELEKKIIVHSKQYNL